MATVNITDVWERITFERARRDPEIIKCIEAARREEDRERDGFEFEMAMQYGFVLIDDDGDLLACSSEELTDLMSVLGFRTRREKSADGDDLALPDWVRPGVSFRYDFGPGKLATGRKFHVRAIVDGRAVIREWWKGKRRWNYTVEGPEYFLAFRDGLVVGN